MRATRQALELRRTVQRFAERAGLDRREAAKHLERIAAPAERLGLSDADAFRVASEAADVLTQFGDHHTARVILSSSWDAGVLPTLAGPPLRDHAPVESVLEVADAVCARFFPEQWADFVATSDAEVDADGTPAR